MHSPYWLLSGWGWGAGPWRLKEEQWAYCTVIVPRERDFLVQVQRLLDCWKSPKHLVGWSLGGLLALCLANECPDKVLSLTLLACNPCFYSDGDWPGMDPVSGWRFAEKLEQNPHLALQEFLLLQCLGEENVRLRYKTLLHCPAGLLPVAKYPLGAQLGWLRQDRRDLLKPMPFPAQLILGDGDQLVLPEVAERFSLSGWDVQIWPHTGHVIPWQHARLWAQLQSTDVH